MSASLRLVSAEAVEQLGIETWAKLRQRMPVSRDPVAQRRVAEIATRLLTAAGETPSRTCEISSVSLTHDPARVQGLLRLGQEVKAGSCKWVLGSEEPGGGTTLSAEMKQTLKVMGSMRERIRSVAGDLYVLHGHDGFSFADIAETLGTTRANIHHHFGSKAGLMEDLIEQFARDAVTRIELHWTEGDAPFFDRMSAQLEDLRQFYTRFNTKPGDRNVWSPLSRLRHDLLVLGEPAAIALERANRAYDWCLRQALNRAVESQELSAATPVEDLARVVRVLLLSCPSMTQDSGSFAEIERLFTSTANMISRAWGPRRNN